MSVVALESETEKQKRILIENALQDKSSTLATWQTLAITEHGLVNGKNTH